MVRKNNKRKEILEGDPFFTEVDQCTTHDEGETSQRSHGSDNPGLVIITTQLSRSNNFLAWKNSIIRALTTKEKLNYIDEELGILDEGTVG